MSDYKENLAHPIDNNPLWKVMEGNYDSHFIRNEEKIPKQIHQIWLGSPLPEKYNSLIQTWKDKHPGWAYKLWTDDNIDTLELTNKKLFDTLENLGAKSDILRYEIIYQYGGIYVDTDFLCIRNFNSFLDLDFFSGGGPAKLPHTFNGLFGAKPQHPILKRIIEGLTLKKTKNEDDFTEIMKLTGPDFFSEVVLDYMNTHKEEKVVIFPENFFYPFPMELRFDKDIRDCTDLSKVYSYVKKRTYCIHLWHTAWQEPKPKVVPKKIKTDKGWYLRQIPKILHVYWGGEKMPYLRYMTIKTFIDLNPDWTVMVWFPKYLFVKLTWPSFELKYDVSGDDYFPELKKLPVQVKEVDFIDFGYKNNIPESYKSDFVRDHMIYILGGAWADTDIIFFKPMNSLAVNIPENIDKETFVCISSYGHSNGFLMGSQGSKFFGRMSSVIVNELNPDNYQSTGPSMYNKYASTLQYINSFSPVANMGMDVVYAHDANHITEIINGTKPRFTDGSIGLHWYAGHPQWGKFLAETNGGMTNLPDNIIGNLLKNAKK